MSSADRSFFKAMFLTYTSFGSGLFGGLLFIASTPVFASTGKALELVCLSVACLASAYLLGRTANRIA